MLKSDKRSWEKVINMLCDELRVVLWTMLSKESREKWKIISNIPFYFFIDTFASPFYRMSRKKQDVLSEVSREKSEVLRILMGLEARLEKLLRNIKEVSGVREGMEKVLRERLSIEYREISLEDLGRLTLEELEEVNRESG